MKNLVSATLATVALFGLVSTAQADEGTYTKSCKACHAFGPGPKLGNKADWKARIAQGNSTLFDHAINGFTGKKGVMPAKGGNASLSDDAVKAAVKYMVDGSK